MVPPKRHARVVSRLRLASTYSLDPLPGRVTRARRRAGRTVVMADHDGTVGVAHRSVAAGPVLALFANGGSVGLRANQDVAPAALNPLQTFAHALSTAGSGLLDVADDLPCRTCQ
jgi:hypothetical protein